MVRWLALCSLLVLLAGCAPRPRFLGTWKASSGATMTLSADGVMVADSPLGGQRGHWQEQPGELLAIQFDGENASRHSRWWVSSDGKTLTLTPIASGADLKEQAVTYLRQ